MLDRTSFDEVFKHKFEAIISLIEKEKLEGKTRISYPWYIPSNRIKHFQGFKTQIFDRLKAKGFFVTDFQPDFRPEIGGVIRDILICFTVESKNLAETEGYIFT